MTYPTLWTLGHTLDFPRKPATSFLTFRLGQRRPAVPPKPPPSPLSPCSWLSRPRLALDASLLMTPAGTQVVSALDCQPPGGRPRPPASRTWLPPQRGRRGALHSGPGPHAALPPAFHLVHAPCPTGVSPRVLTHLNRPRPCQRHAVTAPQIPEQRRVLAPRPCHLPFDPHSRPRGPSQPFLPQLVPAAGLTAFPGHGLRRSRQAPYPGPTATHRPLLAYCGDEYVSQ